GEPVGSQAIARLPGVDCSSATVRAVMADLEALGYLEKPHTSAGRIPTARGYRYYVDVLLHVTQPPSPHTARRCSRFSPGRGRATQAHRVPQAARRTGPRCARVGVRTRA